MSNNTLYTLIGLVILAILILFGVNILSKYQPTAPNAPSTTNSPATSSNQQLKFDRNVVNGISIEKRGQTYDLNMQQTQQMLSFLDNTQPVDKKDYPTKNDNMGFNRIIIHRLNKPDVVLVPITFEEKNIVFDAHNFGLNSYIVEMSAGEMDNLIQKATKA